MDQDKASYIYRVDATSLRMRVKYIQSIIRLCDISDWEWLQGYDPEIKYIKMWNDPYLLLFNLFFFQCQNFFTDRG